MWKLRENCFYSCGIRGAHHIAPFAADAQIDLAPPPARGWKHILREFEPPDDVPPPVGSARSILTLYGNATQARATNVRMPFPLIPKDFAAGYTACADRDVNEYRQAHKSWSFLLLVNERESDAARAQESQPSGPGRLAGSHGVSARFHTLSSSRHNAFTAWRFAIPMCWDLWISSPLTRNLVGASEKHDGVDQNGSRSTPVTSVSRPLLPRHPRRARLGSIHSS